MMATDEEGSNQKEEKAAASVTTMPMLRELLLDVSSHYGLHFLILSFLRRPDVLRFSCVHRNIQRWMQEEKLSSTRFRKLFEWHETIEWKMKVASIRINRKLIYSTIGKRIKQQRRGHHNHMSARGLHLRTKVQKPAGERVLMWGAYHMLKFSHDLKDIWTAVVTDDPPGLFDRSAEGAPQHKVGKHWWFNDGTTTGVSVSTPQYIDKVFSWVDEHVVDDDIGGRRRRRERLSHKK